MSNESVVYADLSDEDLLKEVHRLASAVSYFNAAEGNWSQETQAREATKRDFWNCMSVVQERGLEFENKGYLI